MKKIISILLGPLSFLLIWILGPFGGMSSEALAILAGTVWISVWWITEAIPIAAT